MTDLADVPEFIRELEPGVHARASRVLIQHYGDAIMLASIAISMKRIADGIDDIRRYGIGELT